MQHEPLRVRFIALLSMLFVSAAFLSGCSTSRKLSIEYPTSGGSELKALPGFGGIDGDDYYVQLVSDFDFTGGQTLTEGCSEIAPAYDATEFSATLMFTVSNPTLDLRHQASGFFYQTSSGKCRFSFDTRKVYLSPWIRLDLSKDTSVHFSFLTSENSDLNLFKLAQDVNAASNLLAFTGVGTGVAVIGRLAAGWMLSAGENGPVELSSPWKESLRDMVFNQVVRSGEKPDASGDARKNDDSGLRPSDPSPEPETISRRSSESHSLPSMVTYAGKRGELTEARFKVVEYTQGSLHFLDPEIRPLGILRVYPVVLSSLLLKTAPNGLPDATDLRLEELWRSRIQVGTDYLDLKQILTATKHADKPNLQPDWKNYAESELQCRKLKILLKDLGFNKFDRNAILYYFLENSNDWKNHNLTDPAGLVDEFRLDQLEKWRKRDFGNCLSAEDYRTMKRMGLSVKTAEDWNLITRSGRKKIQFLGPLQSLERQLGHVVRNPNPDERERQIFPLLATRAGGVGTVLLQNHLSDFGLEKILGIAPIPGDGTIISASQLATLLDALKVDDLSCARPAMEQRKPIRHIGILLFTTRDDSPLARGGALEFEFNGGIISRLSLQHPTFRDFKQSLEDFPEIGGCRIAPRFVDNLF